MSLTEAFEKYRLDVIVYENQSAKTEETHRFVLKMLVEFLSDIPIDELTFQHVREWKASLDKDRSPGTVREYLIRLRVVLKHLRRDGYYSILDYEQVKLPKRIDRDPEFLTKTQVGELIEAVFRPARGYSTINRFRNRALVSMLFDSGLRSAEIRRLNIKDIREDNSFTAFGKNSKSRLAFIGENTRTYLDEYLALRIDKNPALFIADQNGLRLSKHSFQLIFVNARKKVEFDIPLHGHILRHSFATDLLRNGANMRYVKDMLGHTSILTTQMYTHVVDEDLRDAHRKYHTVLAKVG